MPKLQTYLPAGIVFTALGVFLSVCSVSSISYPNYCDAQVPQAVIAVRDSQGVLIELFGRIENFFKRLETYVEVPPTIGMTDIIVKIMVQVLSVLTIATREIKQSRASA
jgi:hypothetical protein